MASFKELRDHYLQNFYPTYSVTPTGQGKFKGNNKIYCSYDPLGLDGNIIGKQEGGTNAEKKPRIKSI